MARCPACEAEIHHVVAEKIELTGAEELIEATGEPNGYAIATCCPECSAIIGF